MLSLFICFTFFIISWDLWLLIYFWITSISHFCFWDFSSCSWILFLFFPNNYWFYLNLLMSLGEYLLSNFAMLRVILSCVLLFSLVLTKSKLDLLSFRSSFWLWTYALLLKLSMEEFDTFMWCLSSFWRGSFITSWLCRFRVLASLCLFCSFFFMEELVCFIEAAFSKDLKLFEGDSILMYFGWLPYLVICLFINISIDFYSFCLLF